MKPILEIQSLGKKYRIQHQLGGYLSFRERMMSALKFERNQVEDFWALKDVSFEVQPGESIGIIGRNGAGKSTLLKILSKITPPTTGRIISRGRIASLLEVGTGFHPELTGRENIFFNGSLLGMKRKEIEAKFDEIVDFSGVEKFLDTPLKHYSSGMQLRLAFAVAAFLEPEILIIDEVLAVGDAEFQKKCMGKMEDVNRSGRTILFVSHQLNTIARLCNKVVFLRRGEIVEMGTASSMINKYLNGEQNLPYYKKWEVKEAPGNLEVKLIEVMSINERRSCHESYDINAPVGIQITYMVMKDDIQCILGLNLYSNDGIHILSSHNPHSTGIKKKKGNHSSTVWIPGKFLSEAIYKVSVAAMSYDPFTIYFHELDALSFSVFESSSEDGARGKYGGNIPGVIRPKLNWTE